MELIAQFGMVFSKLSLITPIFIALHTYFIITSDFRLQTLRFGTDKALDRHLNMEKSFQFLFVITILYA